MEKEEKSKSPLQWHPAFYAGIQIEFKEEAEKLIFEEEHQLSKKPMEIDLLIIKKNSDEPIKKNIGQIFRKYNIVEYKSPGAYLNVDDFYKVYGYACFYKADSSNVDMIKAEDITITYVCEKRPIKLLNYLRIERKASIMKSAKGIYYIEGLYIPVQLIVTKELSEKDNFWLRNLTNQLKEKRDAEKLLNEYTKHQYDNLYKAMMDVIVKANNEVFKEAGDMCDALVELFQDKIDEQVEKKVKERERLLEAKGEQKTYLNLIREGILTIQDVARRLQLSEEAVKSML